MRTDFSARFGAVAAALAILAPDARALEVAGRSVDLGVAAGILAPGPIQVGWYSSFDAGSTFEFTNQTTLLLSAMFDAEIVPWLSLGGRVNTASIEIDHDINLGYYGFDGQDHVLNKETIRVVELMLSAKVRQPITENLRLQPALYVGYIKAFASDPDARDRGLGLNASLEGRYALGKGAFLFAEVGLMAQVYGGVTDIGYARTKYPLACVTVGAGL